MHPGTPCESAAHVADARGAPLEADRAQGRTTAPSRPDLSTDRATSQRRLLPRIIAPLVVASIGLVFIAALWVATTPFPLEYLAKEPLTSTRIVDRHGGLLREVLSSAETRGRWVSLTDISPHLRLATIHAEDKRFFDHPGIDFPSIVRSIWIDLSTGEARTGASTITQQTVKLTVQHGEPRTIGTKLMEVVWAWRLELSQSKDEILEQYLNRIPYGNQVIGAEAASWMYFGKPASLLSLAESAYLAGLPSSPTRLNPYRFPERAKARQRWLLNLMHEREVIDTLSWRTALDEQLALKRRKATIEAPHLTARIAAEVAALGTNARPPVVSTTLDPDLQSRVTSILATHRPDVDHETHHQQLQGAAIVLDTRTSEVLAWVGSRDFFDHASLGENDGVAALRQPGSALKPFIYATFLERGGDPETLLDDSPREFATSTGPYRPQNFDRSFRGPVSVRTALGSSLNVPAVDVLERIGVASMTLRLRELGLTTLVQPPEHYGLGLALGNAEVRLFELAGAYATLGRLGLHRPVRWRSDQVPARSTRTLSEGAALSTLDMLADDRARGIGFGLAGPFDLPYRVAAKTGTSSDFRDNWAFAVTPLHTIGVWVGHFDGTPMGHSPGRHGAAPITRQILQALYPGAARRGDVPWFTASMAAGHRPNHPRVR